MFGFASGIFFLGYLILEVPSNLALHRFDARKWLARIMVTWGVVATAMTLVPNATALVLRSCWSRRGRFLPRHHPVSDVLVSGFAAAKAIGLFMVAVPVSSAIDATVSSTLITWGASFLGLSGWRFMFLAEGAPAILLAGLTLFFLADRPSEASWLPREESDWLTAELEAERRQTASKLHWSLRKALTYPRILALAFVCFGISYGLYALGFFLPTIVSGSSSSTAPNSPLWSPGW